MTTQFASRVRAAIMLLVGWIRPGTRDDRLSEEIRFHLDMAEKRNRRDGLSDGEAARAAALAFGGRERWREDSRDEFRSRLFHDLAQDLRYAARTLRSSPVFTVAAVLTLAVGVGGNVAIFSAVDGVMLKPLPFSREDRLVRIHERDRKKGPDRQHDAVAPGNFASWRAQATAFAAFAVAEPYGFRIKTEEGNEEIRNWNVTSDFFSVLDVKPMIGRLLQASDYVAGPPAAIVLTYASWQTRFGRDPNIVGRHVTLNGAQTTIVGVLPSDFAYLEARQPQEFYAPKILDSSEVRIHSSGWYNAVGRLKPGVTVAQANADLDRASELIAKEFPKAAADLGATVVPLRDSMVGNSSRALVLALAAVGLVLLIACSNVANLMLARTSRRGREFAVRAALGADRWRIIRQVLSESLLIAGLGAIAGVAIAYWGVSVIRATSPSSVPRVDTMRVDARALSFALMTAIATAVLFGLAPAFRAADPSASEELKAGGRSVGTGRQHRIRGALVTAEIAFAIVLLISAGLLVRSFASLLHSDRGYRSDHVLGTLVFTWERSRTPGLQRQFAEQLVERARALPGVLAAGVTTSPPLAGSVGIDRAAFLITGHAAPVGQQPTAHVTSISPGAIDVLHMTLLRGRLITAQDDSASVPVALINQKMASQYFPAEDPVGRSVKVGFYGPATERRVVGIVADTKQTSIERPAEATVYLPNAQAPSGGIWLVLRTAVEPGSLARDVKRIVADLDPSVPVAGTPSLDDILDNALKPRRFTLALFAAFAVAALLLAVIGVYGVLSQGTAERSREIGVRIALGAAPREIVTMVMSQGLGSAVLGIAIGLPAGALAARLLGGLLYSVTPFDSVTLVAVSAIMLGTATVACYLPARRATRVDPVVALREG